MVEARRANPPAKPPKRKIWSCLEPDPLRLPRRGASAALKGRYASARSIRFAPSVVDFVRFDKGGLGWYRIKGGKLRRIELIPRSKLGVSGSIQLRWRNARELLLWTGGDQLAVIRFARGGGKAGLAPKGQRWRIRKIPRLRRGFPKQTRGSSNPMDDLTVTTKEEVWISRCAEYHGYHSADGPGCMSWKHVRVLPSVWHSYVMPTEREAKPWNLAPPAGHGVKIVPQEEDTGCLYCYRGRRGYVMFNNVERNFQPIVRLQRTVWLGRSLPFFAAYFKRSSTNYYGVTTHSINLYEACRGYPVGNVVHLKLGPKPYLAYRQEHGNTWIYRYDGVRFALEKNVGPPLFRPLP